MHISLLPLCCSFRFHGRWPPPLPLCCSFWSTVGAPLHCPCSLKEYERQAWVLAGWQEVFVNVVHGQLQNLFLSLCQQLLAAAALAAPPGLSAAVVGSARSTVESAAPFAAVQRRRTLSLPEASSSGPAGGGSGDAAADAPPPLRLLLCHLCKFAEREAVGLALVLLQQLYPERLLAGGEELPAFQPTELGRQLSATAGTLLQGYVDAHGASLAAAADASNATTDWGAAREPRAPRPVCDAFLEKAAGEGWSELLHLVEKAAGEGWSELLHLAAVLHGHICGSGVM